MKLITKENDKYILRTYEYGEESFNNYEEQKWKGILSNKVNGRVVCRGLGHFITVGDVNINDNDNDNDNNSEMGLGSISWDGLKEYNIKDFRITEAVDGFQVRVFYDDGEWRLMTNRQIEASKAKWSTDCNMEDMFWEALGLMGETETEKEISKNRFFSELERNCIYIFNVMHYNNRVVVRVNSNCVYFICRIVRDESKEWTNWGFDFETPAPSGSVRISEVGYENWDELEEDMKRNVCKRGVILYNIANNRFYKVHNSWYESMKILKSDVNYQWQSYLYHYIRLVRNGLMKMFLEEFPEYGIGMRNTGYFLMNFCNEMYDLYYRHRIMKEPITYHDSIKGLMYKLHGQYLEDRVPINQELILHYLIYEDIIEVNCKTIIEWNKYKNSLSLSS